MNCKHEAHELRLTGVSARYGEKLALEGAEFSVTCGSRLALIGPNGAGKSTLLRLLAGLMPSSGGDMTWRGAELTRSTREIAYLPQLDEHQKHFPISVRDVVEMGRFPHLGHFGRFKQKDQEKVDSAIATMQLEDLQGRQIDQLSGGQRQRTFIARALAQESHVILLDEPYNGLDVESRCHLAETLIGLAEKEHLIIASHHNIDNAAALFDLALVLNTQQMAFGPVEECLAQEPVRHLLHACHPTALPA